MLIQLDIRDAYIEFKKIHELDKILCEICIYKTKMPEIVSFNYHIYDSTGHIISGTVLGTNGFIRNFVFDINAKAYNYFVRVEFSLRNSTKQFQTFVFFTSKTLNNHCTCKDSDKEDTCDSENESEPDTQRNREDVFQPPLPEEEFDVEII
ncbi:hypothetical protein COB52_04130, partial [Candidatus Kaiserbacteria bacterium]